MSANQRQAITRAAAAELSSAVERICRKHGITFGEIVDLLADQLHHASSVHIRRENEDGPADPHVADDRTLDSLHLPTRTMKAINDFGISTVGELLQTDPCKLMAQKNYGESSLTATRQALLSLGVHSKHWPKK